MQRQGQRKGMLRRNVDAGARHVYLSRYKHVEGARDDVRQVRACPGASRQEALAIETMRRSSASIADGRSRAVRRVCTAIA